MYIILGGTGHVGSAVTETLLAKREPVTIVTHDASKGEQWTRRGARVAIADVHDTDALRRIFRQGRRAFLLNPPAHPSTDTDVEERRTVASIVAALDGSGLEKLVAQSTYGAQPGERRGDLNTLHEMEQALKAQQIPASIIRAAYYFSNWDTSLQTARDDGVVHTMFPTDFKLPMVAPEDLGRVAARLLTEPAEHIGLRYVEGPERYSTADVAAAFADALKKPIKVVTTPREQWEEAFRQLGFSNAAAESYSRMTAITLDELYEPASPMRGSISLRTYISDLVAAQS